MVEAAQIVEGKQHVLRLVIAARMELEHVAEPELACDRPGEPGLAGARLARHEQRLLDGEGRVDGGDQLGVCQIAAAFRALRDFGARRQRAVALVALPRRCCAHG